MDTLPISPIDRRRLPRLTADSYRGAACVHWTMTLDQRATGWLDSAHHAALRELLLHTCHRYDLACPTYCLMPDHGHFLLLGLTVDADQRLAVAWFRRQWNTLLAPRRQLQRQPHDHVLRDLERARDAFQTMANYIRQNPCRASLVAEAKQWPYGGSIFPGVYPLNPHTPDHWERFWRAHEQRVNAV